MMISGTVKRRLSQHQAEDVAVIELHVQGYKKNPIMDYLQRHGHPLERMVKMENVIPE
jgi:hypothetical protein